VLAPGWFPDYSSIARYCNDRGAFDLALQAAFTGLARILAENEATIVAELAGVQGKPVDLKGYYHPDEELVRKAMRPSATFNAALEALSPALT